VSNLLLPRLNGLWGGNVRLEDPANGSGGTGPAQGAGGEEWTHFAFREAVGEVNYNSLAITQSGTELTATLVSDGTGLSCTYKGTIGSGTDNNLVLHSVVGECKQTLNFLAPGGGPRTLNLVGSSITATYNAPIQVTGISGTVAYTYNVAAEPGLSSAFIARQRFDNFTRR
jgi:hypothetical protein